MGPPSINKTSHDMAHTLTGGKNNNGEDCKGKDAKLHGNCMSSRW